MADLITSDLALVTDATGYGGTLSLVQGSSRSRVRQVAADGALAIAATDQIILLLSSTAAAKPATFATETAAQDGQVVWVSLVARSGGSYTVDTDEGTTTLDTGGDFMGLQYSIADTAWHRLVYYDAANATIGSGAVDSAQIANGAIDLVHMSAESVDSAQYVDGSIDPEHFAAGAVDSAAIASGAVDPVHLSATSVAPAGADPCAILASTTEVLLTVVDATNVAITTTAAEPGQRVMLRMVAAAGGGSYTLAVSGGTLTLNSVGETAVVQRNVADAAWHVLALTAGDAGGNAATIV